MARPAADRRVRVGTAGWSIPRPSAPRFASAGTHLERYARVFAGVEINSSFHRPHAAATYAAWRDQTPAGFRFAVKMPRTITHDLRLVGTRRLLETFLRECDGLAGKRGPLLVQLPPSLAYATALATRFFRLLRGLDAGRVVCEPRHPSWFSPAATAVLEDFRIARVAADPPPVPEADRPGGWPGLTYVRLHGSPHRYWSAYDQGALAAVAAALQHDGADERWCIFDNTAAGAAIENAWDLQARLSRRPARQ
jgi:uncharacterized protein YecE (DUF72 family)